MPNVGFSTAIEWVKLDPFNLACYDAETDTVLIDKCFRGTELESSLLNHEFRHKTGKIYEEFIDLEGIKTEIIALKYKPLHLFQLIFPAVMCIRDNKKFFFKLDLFGLIVLIAFILGSTYMVSAKYQICLTHADDAPHGPNSPVCTTMSWWDARTGKGQTWLNEQAQKVYIPPIPGQPLNIPSIG